MDWDSASLMELIPKKVLHRMEEERGCNRAGLADLFSSMAGDLKSEVTAAKTANMEIRIRSDTFDLDETLPYLVPVVKVGNTWYLDLM